MNFYRVLSTYPKIVIGSTGFVCASLYVPFKLDSSKLESSKYFRCELSDNIYERSEAFDKLPLDAKYEIVQVYNSPYLSIEQIRVDLSKRIDKAMAYSSSLRPGDTDCCDASNHVGLLLSVSYFFNS